MVYASVLLGRFIIGIIGQWKYFPDFWHTQNIAWFLNWLPDWWWLEHVLFFHILGIIIPVDFHIFQRVWNHQPASHWVYYVRHLMVPRVRPRPTWTFGHGITIAIEMRGTQRRSGQATVDDVLQLYTVWICIGYILRDRFHIAYMLVGFYVIYTYYIYIYTYVGSKPRITSLLIFS